MHRVKFTGVAVVAVCAFTALVASVAAAEPLLSVLSGEKISELKYEGTGGASTLETLSLKTIGGTKAKVTATFNALTDATADTGNATVTFEGTKKEKVSCRSESKAGVKDAVETIVTQLSLTTAAELTKAKELEGMLVNKVEGDTKGAGETEVIINCGGVKELVLGTLPCLVTPINTEIAAGNAFNIKCVEEKGDLVTGECKETKNACEKLTNTPLLASLGAGFEDAAEEVTLEGKFNKMVTFTA